MYLVNKTADLESFFMAGKPDEVNEMQVRYYQVKFYPAIFSKAVEKSLSLRLFLISRYFFLKICLSIFISQATRIIRIVINAQGCNICFNFGFTNFIPISIIPIPQEFFFITHIASFIDGSLNI